MMDAATQSVPRTKPLFRCEGIVKEFGGFRVLDGVSFSVGENEIVGLVGPNGSGKSTLLNVISGFYPFQKGELSLDDQDIKSLSMDRRARRGLVRTFQLPAMPSRMTTLDVLLGGDTRESGPLASFFGGAKTREINRDCLAKAQRTIGEFKLEAVADLPASSLSGGQKKLLSVATALMCGPKLLCLDEPTAGVHPAQRRVLVDILKRCRDRGTAIIVVEHDMKFIADLCDRCVVIDRGEVIADCLPSELSKSDRVAEAYLGVQRTVGASQ